MATVELFNCRKYFQALSNYVVDYIFLVGHDVDLVDNKLRMVRKHLRQVSFLEMLESRWLFIIEAFTLLTGQGGTMRPVEVQMLSPPPFMAKYTTARL